MSENNYTVKVYNQTKLITEITVQGGNVSFKNYADGVDKIWQPFGEKEIATYEDLQEYYEDRCFPRERENADDILKRLDIPFYDGELICRKTHGTQFDDFCWLQFSDEPQVTYEDIRLR